MKKILICLLMLLLLCGCSNDELKGGDLDDIKKRGYINVAMEGNWKPFTYHNENDELVGFDVEVAKYIADYIGVEVKYVEGKWDGILAGVEAGRYDMMVNGCDVTEDRQKNYDFSNAYAYDKVVVMTSKENNDIKTEEDLNGKTTANTISSTYAEIGESLGATVEGVDDFNATIELLKSGRIDATLNAEVAYLDYVETYPDADVKIACYTSTSFDIAIPMKKGSSDLVKVVNEAIAQARQDGTLKALSEKYFGIDITTK
ncbi:MAG: transporter substrate-binding domain-containing protein [Erysipelotrichaceae bacterium]|nr:transporter substrate-binding domain-containing protein [Erysipelotrichaceae bacterium]